MPSSSHPHKQQNQPINLFPPSSSQGALVTPLLFRVDTHHRDSFFVFFSSWPSSPRCSVLQSQGKECGSWRGTARRFAVVSLHWCGNRPTLCINYVSGSGDRLGHDDPSASSAIRALLIINQDTLKEDLPPRRMSTERAERMKNKMSPQVPTPAGRV